MTLLVGVMAHHKQKLKGTELGRPPSPGSLRTATKLAMINLRVDERERWSASCGCLEMDGVRPYLARLVPLAGVGGKAKGVVVIGHMDLTARRQHEAGPPIYSCQVSALYACTWRLAGDARGVALQQDSAR